MVPIKRRSNPWALPISTKEDIPVAEKTYRVPVEDVPVARQVATKKKHGTQMPMISLNNYFPAT
jgi:hypothetical protein